MEYTAFDPSIIDAAAVAQVLSHIPPHFWVYLALAALAQWRHSWVPFGYLAAALVVLWN